ncbi:MAG: hypothetical protein JOZ54_16950 [Acidobacteria bacterium]|nr:hypothetical protein [Acidobacteriota bacterium]
MSLRIFHIIFVIVCVGLSLCVGVWGIRSWMAERSAGALALGIVFLVSGLVLVLYGKKAFVKLKELD